MLDLLFGRRVADVPKVAQFPAEIYKLLDQTLQARSRGRFALGKSHVFGQLYMAEIDTLDQEARIDTAIGLADDLENELARVGVFSSVAIRAKPLRLELARSDAKPIMLSTYWRKIRELPPFGYSPGIIYQGVRERLLNVMTTEGQNTHVGVFAPTSGGKTTFAYSAALTLALRSSPQQLQMVVVDPTGVNLTALEGLPHLAAPVAVTPSDCVRTVRAVVDEMERRAAARTRGSNRITLIVDEFSDLITTYGEISDGLCRLAQKGRGFGINLMVYGQKMSAAAPTILSTNLTARVVGRMLDQADAVRTAGTKDTQAGRLGGRGAFEFHNGVISGRMQGFFVSESDTGSMIGDISQRWHGQKAEALRLPTLETESDDGDPLSRYDQTWVDAAITKMNELGERFRVAAVERAHEEVFGKRVNYGKAKSLYQLLTGDNRETTLGSAD